MTVSRPYRRVLVAMILVAAGLLWCVWRWRNDRRFRHTMAAVQNEIDAGRYATAARRLTPLLAENPGSDEAGYFLGLCERAMGHSDAARNAWVKIPPDSRFASRAIQGRMELEVERGRLAEAERIIELATADRRMDGSGLRLYLGQILTQQGRVDKAKQIVEDRWEQLNALGEGAAEPAINLVRLHIDLRSNPASVESIKSFLDQMGSRAPDDDRVWLGKANLAIRLSDYDEARKWLTACMRRRPDDIPVWCAQLDWAMATNSVQSVRQALERLPAGEFEPARIFRLAAWLAAQNGDLISEQRSLEKLVEADPTDYSALERQAEIESRNGRQERAERLQQEKAEIERLQTRYQKLYRRNQPIRDAAEMARLASRLGYNFEARAFLTVAIDVDDDNEELHRELAQLEKSKGTRRFKHHTLASLLATELGLTNPQGCNDPFTLERGGRSTVSLAR